VRPNDLNHRQLAISSEENKGFRWNEAITGNRQTPIYEPTGQLLEKRFTLLIGHSEEGDYGPKEAARR
jgi:hypothetical protein